MDPISFLIFSEETEQNVTGGGSTERIFILYSPISFKIGGKMADFQEK